MIDHLLQNWQELASSMFAGATVYGFASYMARTIPPVENRWVAWIIGGIQWALANPDKAKEQKQP